MSKSKSNFHAALVASLSALAADRPSLEVPSSSIPPPRRLITTTLLRPVPVYYDLGQSGRCLRLLHRVIGSRHLRQPVGKALVTKGYGDWSGIKTASLRANVVGDFSLIGLPDIDSTNVTDIIGTSNGRGIYVIFDADGSIMQNFFGVGDGRSRNLQPAVLHYRHHHHYRELDGAERTVPSTRLIPTPRTSRAWLPTSSDTRSAWRTPRPTARRYFYSQFNGENVGPQ